MYMVMSVRIENGENDDGIRSWAEYRFSMGQRIEAETI
jgi:hypothetical protein